MPAFASRFRLTGHPPGDGSGLRYGSHMASPQSQTTPQRLAAIREQMSLLTDYL